MESVQTRQVMPSTPLLHTDGVLQRKCDCGQHTVAGGSCSGCANQKLLQRKASAAEPVNTAPPVVNEVLRSPGRPLDPETRAFFEPRFGHDFSHVRTHTDTKAAESTRSVSALAYTVGRNIVFGQGQYAPQTTAGRRLLAHELTHSLQQSRGGSEQIQGRLVVNSPNDSFEQEADQIAASVMGGSAHNFSHVKAHSDMRGRSAEDPFGDIDLRFGVEDPVHQSQFDTFRERQGQPPGGVDEMGNQVGPTDAEIKYRPQPIAVRNGPFHAPIDTPTLAGMEIQISVVMSSNNAELPFVQDSEVVSTSFDHIGSCTSIPPFTSSNSEFMPAFNIPNDRHTSGKARIIDIADNHGGSGSYSRNQLDIYNHARYGIFNPLAIPNSGYKITRSIIAGPGTRLRFRVDKTPQACTIGNYSTAAGPSPAQHDEVVVRS